MQIGVQRVQQNHSATGQHSGKESCERRAVRFCWSIAVAQDVRQQRTALLIEHVGGFANGVGAGWTEHDSAYGLASIDGRRQFEARGAAIVKPGGVADFVEIVVFRGQPEDGDRVDARAREFLGDLYGHERFVDGIGWTAEESYLLAADYGDRTFGQAIEIFVSFGVATKGAVLFAEDGGYFTGAFLREF